MVDKEDMKELVLARLQTMPDYIEVHLGDGTTLTKDDLIQLVAEGDEMGEEYMQNQLNYIRSFTRGAVS